MSAVETKDKTAKDEVSFDAPDNEKKKNGFSKRVQMA